MANYNGTTKKIQMVPGREIHWPGNAVPSDIPPCGFDNSDPLCRKGEQCQGGGQHDMRPPPWAPTSPSPASSCCAANLSTLEVLSLVVSLILLAITIASFFIYRWGCQGQGG